MGFFIFLMFLIIGLMSIEVAIGFIDMSERSGADDHWVPGLAGIVIVVILLAVFSS